MTDDWKDPLEIWLSPWCDGCDRDRGRLSDEGRLWCEDKSMFDACDECGRKPVRYVLAPEKDVKK